MGNTYVYRDGARLTPIMAYWIDKLDEAFYKRWGLHILVSSGIRTRAEQKMIFLSRYVLAANVNGRHVYDWRWAEGRLYGRISPLGTVAPWDSPIANHVLENTGSGAVDLRDTGSDAGIMTKGSARWQWMQDNIRKFNFSNEGDNFGEAWHKKFLVSPWASLPAKPFPPTPTPTPEAPEEKDEDMPIQVKSKQTGNWYAIYELTRTLIRYGKVGTVNHKRALAYNQAQNKDGKNSPSSWVTVDKTVVQSLLRDQEARLEAFLTSIGKADAIEAMRADIAALIAEEEAAPANATLGDDEA